MNRVFSIFIAAALLLSGCYSRKKIKLPGELVEVSGLYYAGSDSLWWHNDGGHGPKLYLTDGRGNLKRTVAIPQAINRDWEDITADEAGRVYIGDFGNNNSDRRDLLVYRFDFTTGALDSISFSFPDQKDFPPPPERASFDAEAVIWFQDSLHIFSKNRLIEGNYYTKHYVLPASPGHHTPELRDSLYLKKRVVTGAALSPDGGAIALVSYYFKRLLGFIPLSTASVFLIEDFTGSDFLAGSVTRYRIPKFIAPVQYESVDFAGPEILWVASENTILFKQKMRRIRIRRKRVYVSP